MARKPFRFGLMGKANSREEWIEQAKKAEDLGYSSYLASDHLYWEFSPIAALQAAASSITTLRIGSNVFSNDFRHPVPRINGRAFPRPRNRRTEGFPGRMTMASMSDSSFVARSRNEFPAA
jgi:hypothetical protein